MQRRKGKDERSRIIRALDQITPKIVKLRDAYTCQQCGSMPKARGYHAAHIIGRSSFKTRWNLLNVLGLCRGCHQYAHTHPRLFRIWFAQRFPVRARYIDDIELEGTKTIHTDQLQKWLDEHKQKLAELEAEFE